MIRGMSNLLVRLTVLLAIVAFLPSGVVGANSSNTPNLVSTQVALNGGFNTYPSLTSKVPSSWTPTNFSPVDGKDTVHVKEGTASVTFKIPNTSTEKDLAQPRPINGQVGYKFQVSLWYRCVKTVSTLAPPLSLARVKLFQGGKRKQSMIVNLYQGGTCAGNWIAASGHFNAMYAYTNIKIELVCRGGVGQCGYDGLKVLVTP